jgi:predicted XRE-type DNA-binding protein
MQDVFEHLGFKHHLKDLQTKSALLTFINIQPGWKNLSYEEAAQLLDISEVELHALKHGNISCFTIKNLSDIILNIANNIYLLLEVSR